MPINGRVKGCVGEREVAALLAAWWAQVEPYSQFVRTPLSGGWANSGVRSGFRASGDLMTTAEQFPFAVEVKRRENWCIRRLTNGQRSPVWSWWRQAQTAAAEMNVHPMLWIRRNVPRVRGVKLVGSQPAAWLVMIGADLARDLSLPGPDICWNAGMIEPDVDVGAIMPAGYSSPRFLEIPPGAFATRDALRLGKV